MTGNLLLKTAINPIGQELRPYQLDAIKALNDKFAENNRLLLIMATGTGKTTVFADYIRRCAIKGYSTLVIAHREELINQAKTRIENQVGLQCGIEMADRKSDNEKVIIGSVQSLMGRLHKFDHYQFRFIVVDEAHHISAKSYQKILTHFKNYKFLGVTATPDRTDRKTIMNPKYFDDIAFNYSLYNAIKDGWLAEIEAYRSDVRIDLTGLRKRMDDWSMEDLEARIIPKIAEIADGITRVTKDLKTLIFTPSVATSKMLFEILRSRNYSATYLDGNTPSNQRSFALRQFEKGEIQYLCNCALFTEGVDIPSIESVVLARPTMSRILYSQMVGRGTRKTETKKVLKLIEFTYNSESLDLCTPADLFISRETPFEVREAIKKTKEREDDNRPIKMFEVIEEVRRSLYDKYTIARAMEERYLGGYERFDPLLVARLMNESLDGELKITWNGKALKGKATERQLDLLYKFKVDVDNFSLSKSQASLLIDILMTEKCSAETLMRRYLKC